MDWKIPLFKIYWDQDDIATVSSALSRGMSWAVGPEVALLEKSLADYVGTKYCITFNSGTSALHAILLAYGIGQGDEVIVPSFTFVATANAALFVGARPVFADIERRTYGLDPVDVERKITPRTKAIIPVHYGGCPCAMLELKEIARRHGLLLIEDAAEALGAHINGVRVASVGEAAILSFCQNKVITTGEGGAVVTNSKDVYDKLKLTRSHGRQDTVDYFSTTESLDYVSLGYNFRLSNISCALGLSQLRKLDKLVEMRRHHAKRFDARLSAVKGVELTAPPDGYHNIYQMYTIAVPAPRRDSLMAYLAERGIMTKVYFSPIHHTHFYKQVLKYDCRLPVTEAVSRQVITLPMYPSLSETEIDLMTGHIADFMSRRK